MNTTDKAKSQRIPVPFYDGTVTNELSADYILPDTYPDVKQILRVRARPVMIGRFISGKRLEFNGAVDYIVIFSAEAQTDRSDPDNIVSKPDTLHAVHFAAEYSGAPGELEHLDSCDISISPRVVSCTAKLQNPRKLSIKSTVATDILLTELMSCQPKIEGAKSVEDELRLEELQKSFPALISKHFIADHEQLSENLEPDASAPAIDEIVSCNAELHFHEAKPSRGSDGFTVALKGEALIDCIYKAIGDAGDYRSFQRKLPLSYIVSADEYAPDFENVLPETLCAEAEGILSELNAAVGEDSYGERRILELDMSFDIDIRLMADTLSDVTLDVYSIERETECEQRQLELYSLGKLVPANFSVNESVAREGLNIPEGDWNVVDTAAEVRMSQAAVTRGRAQLTGEAAVNCILSDHAGSFASADFTIPIKCELSAGDICEPVSFICGCRTSDLRTRIDSGRISCDFEVSLNALFIRKARVDAVVSVTLSPETRKPPEDAASVILCYPSDGESLWQIAKRYNTTTGAISALNPSIVEAVSVSTSGKGQSAEAVGNATGAHVIMIPAGRGPVTGII